MLHHKLIAKEQPGTYLITEPITDEELMTIANQIARSHLATGEPITNKHIARRALQTLLQNRDHGCLVPCFWITSTGSWPMRSCFTALWIAPASIPRGSGQASAGHQCGSTGAGA